jgi:hypothetical protein
MMLALTRVNHFVVMYVNHLQIFVWQCGVSPFLRTAPSQSIRPVMNKCELLQFVRTICMANKELSMLRSPNTENGT